MFGPVEERRHDGFIPQESKVVDEMEHHPGYHLSDDEGHPLKSWLIIPFSDSQRIAEQCSFNHELSRARIAVEWSFAELFGTGIWFALILNMKVLTSPIATPSLVTTFLTICLSCVRRKNQACKSFHCQPPSLEVYLAGLPGSSPINEADYASDDDVLNFFADESDMSSENESSD
ncbi:hypothetical protein PF008_g3796 [Phytophthora fragariae]|uniref:DDE Tnp4 domain-containing protein n=1 Tax=Phytophthora fragariae TaxID=53985 RepID=A0A6G0SE82_9STRA|nr:hypothetical protein PF008_g3796 [Phytophthora fragariae]